MDSSREEFEEAFHQARCQLIACEEDRPVAWAFWSASRGSMVIELPVIVDKEWANTHAERSAMREAIGWCKKRIEAAGLKVKP